MFMFNTNIILFKNTKAYASKIFSLHFENVVVNLTPGERDNPN